jgi:ATP-dependent DNA helicase RecG
VFHSASLRWYRDRFHATNPGFDVEQPHHEFLDEWGYLVKESGKLLPARGAVALFGSLRGVRSLVPKPFRDVRFLGSQARRTSTRRAGSIGSCAR